MQTTAPNSQIPETADRGGERSTGRLWPMQRLVVAGIVGHVFSIATAWLLPLVSEYTLFGDNISELAIGRYGYVQTAAFFAVGLGSLALAVAIRRATRGSWGSRAASVLVAFYGVGPIVAAVFPTDRVDSVADLQSLSVVMAIHIGSALVAFLSAVAGMFVLTRTFKRDPRWRTLWPASLALACVTLIMLFLQQEGPMVGLYQRLLTGTATLWLMLVAARLWSLAEAPVPARPVRDGRN